MSFLTFILTGETFTNSFNRKKYHELLAQITEDIDIQLSQNKPYFVKSKVNNENFENFLKYWYEEKKPIFTQENIFDFFILSNEFGLMKDLISKSKENVIINLLCLERLEQSQEILIYDKSSLEQFVARNLDQIIIEYPELLQKVPISSLYNIFNHKEKNFGDPVNTYNFILNSAKKNPNFIVLLQCLDRFELPKEIINECISKQKEHFNFLPNNYNQIAENLIDENKKLAEKLNSEMFTKRKYCHEIKLNDIKDDGIIAYLAERSTKYERKFIVSLSSNDPYNLICPKNNVYDGFRSNTKLKYFDEPERNSSFTIELKDPELVYSINFYGTDKKEHIVQAFSYQINDDEEIDVSPKEAAIFQNNDISKRIITKKVDPPVIISKIKITPKGLENEKMTWPFFGGLELFSDNNPNGVFKSLIEKNKDPHRDLKPLNVLIDENFYPLICDFGESKITYFHASDLKMESEKGTLAFRAPEATTQEQYDLKINVFSFALLFYSIYFERYPYENYPNQISFHMAMCSGQRPDLSQIQNQIISDLIKKCWNASASLRPSFREIVEEMSKDQFRQAMNANKADVENYLSLFNDEAEEKSVKSPMIIQIDADNGDVDEMYNLALLYLYGNDMPKNIPMALNYFNKAADSGNEKAMYIYAYMVYHGYGTIDDHSKALKYIKMAAEKKILMQASIMQLCFFVEWELMKKKMKQFNA